MKYGDDIGAALLLARVADEWANSPASREDWVRTHERIHNSPPVVPDEDRLLTIHETALLVRRRRHQVFRACRSGRIPAKKVGVPRTRGQAGPGGAGEGRRDNRLRPHDGPPEGGEDGLRGVRRRVTQFPRSEAGRLRARGVCSDQWDDVRLPGLAAAYALNQAQAPKEEEKAS